MTKDSRPQVRVTMLELLESRALLHGGFHGGFAGGFHDGDRGSFLRIGDLGGLRYEPTRFSRGPGGPGDFHYGDRFDARLAPRVSPTTTLVVYTPTPTTTAVTTPPVVMPPVSRPAVIDRPRDPWPSVTSISRPPTNDLTPARANASTSTSVTANPFDDFVALFSRTEGDFAQTAEADGAEIDKGFALTDFDGDSQRNHDAAATSESQPDKSGLQQRERTDEAEELIELGNAEEQTPGKRKPARLRSTAAMGTRQLDGTIRPQTLQSQLRESLAALLPWRFVDDAGPMPLPENPDVIEMLAAELIGMDASFAPTISPNAPWEVDSPPQLQPAIGIASTTELFDEIANDLNAVTIDSTAVVLAGAVVAPAPDVGPLPATDAR